MSDFDLEHDCSYMNLIPHMTLVLLGCRKQTRELQELV